ncbi:hypothetical protein GCM10027614_66980 [Micromonospora vulcania]
MLLAVLGWSGFSAVQRIHDGEPLLPGRATSPAPRPVDESGNSLGPFVGTPAEKFAVGEAAITLPAARAAAPFTAKQVADALAKVKQALVQSRLDSSMLLGDPEKFLALLAPDTRTETRKDFATGDSLTYATQILRDSNPRFEFSDGIRGSGTVEYRSTTDDNGIRVLAITTRFLWVYSFDLPRPQTYPPGAELVTLRDEVIWHVPHPDDVEATSVGLWLDSGDVTVLNATCTAIRKGKIDLETVGEAGLPAAAPTGTSTARVGAPATARSADPAGRRPGYRTAPTTAHAPLRSRSSSATSRITTNRVSPAQMPPSPRSSA